jgi:glycerol-3-phosphate cytidylyltransferase
MIKRGIIAGSFDIIHPGYIRMFKEAREKYCDSLTVALHTQPETKTKCILSVEERVEILSSIKFVDNIIIYENERELSKILEENKFNVRILGDDYLGKNITGPEFSEEIVYINRSHGWSTSRMKELIYQNFINSRLDKLGSNQ